MKKFFPHPLLSLALLVAWLLLNNTLSFGHLLLGAFLGLIIPYMSASFWPEHICIKKPFVFLRFIAILLYDIVVANITVALQVLGENKNLHPSFITYPLSIQNQLGISVLASTISLTPGTVSCDLSVDQSTLLIHALSAQDKEKVIAHIHQRYEKPLMEVFVQC
ncbi:MAG: Na+/H+ antiporter subunit E [Helicobacteraceae bacterium]|nr:Na+/H+ antiporter subunit E [Helicobacteraceae bacterium]